jgi:hypothetical protein
MHRSTLYYQREMTHLPLLCLMQSPLLLPPTTDVWDPHVRVIFNLQFTRRGHLLFRCFFFGGSRAEAPPPPFLLPSPLLDSDCLEAEKAGRGELRSRGRWDRAPPRLAARPLARGRWRDGGVELPQGRWGAPLRSAGGRWGRDPLGRRARLMGRAPPRPAGASSPDGAGARLCPRRCATSDLGWRREAPRWPSSAMNGSSEVEEGPDVWVPHVSCLREGRSGAQESFHIIVPAWKGDLVCHVGQNGKCVAKTSFIWQMCKLNSKSGF